MSEEPKKPIALLVDDDRFLLDMYSLKFSKGGLSVVAACGSKEALQHLRDGLVPDVMVLDIIMPTMDGLELLGVIRKENLASKATVIMLTNQSQSSEIEKAKQLGVDGYIVKATTIPSEVLSEVKNIMSNKR
ncbi:MAG TPA: response regulator [Candidatus Paceibacterota bacterium]